MPMQINGTATPNSPPSGLVERQLSIEMGNTPPRLWCGVPTTVDASGRVQVSPPPDYVSTAALTTALAGYLPLTGGSLAGPGNLSVGGNLVIPRAVPLYAMNQDGVTTSNLIMNFYDTNLGTDYVVVANGAAYVSLQANMTVLSNGTWLKWQDNTGFASNNAMAYDAGNNLVIGEDTDNISIGRRSAKLGLPQITLNGVTRLPNAAWLQFRNAANSGNLNGITYDATNNLIIGDLNRPVQFQGPASFPQTLSVGGALTASSTLAVTGTSTLTGAITSNGGLTITAVGATITPGVTINGNVALTGSNAIYRFADRVTAANWEIFAFNGNFQVASPTVNNALVVTVAGNGSIPGNFFAANFPSERRFKDNVVPYSRGLEAICGLQPVSWEWNGLSGIVDPHRPVQYGVLADETETVLPEATGRRRMAVEGREELVKTTDDKPILYALVNAVRELAAAVTELKGSER